LHCLDLSQGVLAQPSVAPSPISAKAIQAINTSNGDLDCVLQVSQSAQPFLARRTLATEWFEILPLPAFPCVRQLPGIEVHERMHLLSGFARRWRNGFVRAEQSGKSYPTGAGQGMEPKTSVVAADDCEVRLIDQIEIVEQKTLEPPIGSCIPRNAPPISKPGGIGSASLSDGNARRRRSVRAPAFEAVRCLAQFMQGDRKRDQASGLADQIVAPISVPPIHERAPRLPAFFDREMRNEDAPRRGPGRRVHRDAFRARFGIPWFRI
jgi:hypothetical protein